MNTPFFPRFFLKQTVMKLKTFAHCGILRVLKRIFESNRDNVTGEWRRIRNKKLYVLYSSPNIIQVLKSRRLRWARHVARMREKVHKRPRWGNLR